MNPRNARETRVIRVDPTHPDPDAIAEAAEVLRRGGLVAFPTETVYGLGAVADDARAVVRIFEAKGRPANNPLIVHGHDVGAVRPAVANWPLAAAGLAARFWPGPLTIVLPRTPLMPDAVTAGRDTVGVRVPDCEVARRLLRAVGRPVAAPSANRSNGVSPTTAGHVLEDLDRLVDLILDGGPTHVGIESTVLDLTADPPRVLRPGAITAEQIGRVLGVEVGSIVRAGVPGGESLSSPGQLELHYAPKALIIPCRPEHVALPPRVDPGRIALLVAGQAVPETGDAYDDRVDWPEPVRAARELYATLRRWDDEGFHRIDAVLPPDLDPWRAVRDRLWRASRRWDREGRPA